jgi:NTE family protein
VKSLHLQSLLLSLILLSGSYSAAQEAAAPRSIGRPKLGLVLEGGGALGLAQIGVLQWMEEQHIPVSREEIAWCNYCAEGSE